VSELVLPAPPPLARQVATMVARCLRLSSRSVEALLSAVVIPVGIMLVFVYIFGGAITTGTRYVTYIVPAVILLCAGYSAAMTAVTVTRDLHGGAVDRLRSMDIGGAVVLSGHVAASVARNAVSTLLVLGVALLVGFRPHAGPVAWLAAAGILALFVLALSWLCAAVGLVAGTPEAASGFTVLVMLLPYPSSGFVPVDTLPGWLRGFATHQPATPVIESMRGLLLGTPVGASGYRAVLWCSGITIGSILLCGLLFRRRTG
jgi:ABC-2 type transport system permease protein